MLLKIVHGLIYSIEIFNSIEKSLYFRTCI